MATTFHECPNCGNIIREEKREHWIAHVVCPRCGEFLQKS